MAAVIEYLCNPQSFPESNDILCSRQFMVEERFLIPAHKPNIDQLIDVKVKPLIDTYKFIDSPQGKKVYIRGRLEQEILYSVDEACQPVHAIQTEYVFHTYMKLCDCTSNLTVLQTHSPRIMVEFMEAVKTCSRSISKTIILFTWYPRSLIIPPRPQAIQFINQIPDAFKMPDHYGNYCMHHCFEEVCRPRVKTHRNHKKKSAHKSYLFE